jgi:hypothetical protein
MMMIVRLIEKEDGIDKLLNKNKIKDEIFKKI